MTIYKNKVEYVRTDWFDLKTIKPSEVKKIKLYELNRQYKC